MILDLVVVDFLGWFNVDGLVYVVLSCVCLLDNLKLIVFLCVLDICISEKVRMFMY